MAPAVQLRVLVTGCRVKDALPYYLQLQASVNDAQGTGPRRRRRRGVSKNRTVFSSPSPSKGGVGLHFFSHFISEAKLRARRPSSPRALHEPTVIASSTTRSPPRSRPREAACVLSSVPPRSSPLFREKTRPADLVHATLFFSRSDRRSSLATRPRRWSPPEMTRPRGGPERWRVRRRARRPQR